MRYCLICHRRIRTGTKYCFIHRNAGKETSLINKRKIDEEIRKQEGVILAKFFLVCIVIIIFIVLWLVNKLYFVLGLLIIILLMYLWLRYRKRKKDKEEINDEPIEYSPLQATTKPKANLSSALGSLLNGIAKVRKDSITYGRSMDYP